MRQSHSVSGPPALGIDPGFATPIAGPSIARLLDHVPAMVEVKDRQGRFRFMNRFQAAVYGTTPDAALGRTAGDLLGYTCAHQAGRERTVLDTGRPVGPVEERCADCAGRERDWLVTCVPLHDEAGRVVAVGTTAIEITDQVQRERALARRVEQLDAADRAKTRFMAEIAHEVRTPLSAVLGFADLLRRQRFGPLGDPRYLRFAEDIALSGEQLRALAGDMLDMARLEVGRLDLVEETIAIGPILDQAVRLVATSLAARTLQLERDAAPAVRLLVDPRRMIQVLANLLSNAVRFAPSGSSIRLGVEPAEGGLAIVVEDEGRGIAREDVETALAPFARLAGTEQLEGAGLGLPLAAGLLARHGGRLELGPRSDRATGTRAAALLPAHRILA